MRRRRHPAIRLAVAATLVALLGMLAWRGLMHWRDQSIDRRVGNYQAAIARSASEQGLPADLVRAVVRAESGGDPRAENPRTGARGLMQLLPDAETDAVRRLRIPRGDLFDGEYNIRVGSAYLRMMLDRFDGDVYLAVAGYNWGPGNVDRVRREHPELGGRAIIEQFAPPQTQAYCRKVIAGRWETLNHE